MDTTSLLQLDSDGGQVNRVTLTDHGSKTHCARVIIQGVPAEGVVDTGAEITIVGGELFRKIALANRLKKREFKLSDKTPCTYNLQMIKLDGRIALEMVFGEQIMKSMIYVKDVSKQFLLSEGLCRQLGIVTYHFC